MCVWKWITEICDICLNFRFFWRVPSLNGHNSARRGAIDPGPFSTARGFPADDLRHWRHCQDFGWFLLNPPRASLGGLLMSWGILLSICMTLNYLSPIYEWSCFMETIGKLLLLRLDLALTTGAHSSHVTMISPRRQEGQVDSGQQSMNLFWLGWLSTIVTLCLLYWSVIVMHDHVTSHCEAFHGHTYLEFVDLLRRLLTKINRCHACLVSTLHCAQRAGHTLCGQTFHSSSSISNTTGIRRKKSSYSFV